MLEIQKPYYNSAEDKLGRFIMYEDGTPRESDYESVEAMLRREAMKYLGYEALAVPVRATAFVGKAVVRAGMEWYRGL